MVDKINNKTLDNSLYFYLGFCMLIVVLFTIVQINMMNLLKKNDDQIIKLDSFTSPQKENGMNYYRLKEGDPHQYQFKTTISGEKLNELNGDNYELIVYQFTAQWYKIYFNGFLIGGSGDYQDHNSNIWNQFAKYSIPEQLIKSRNEIKVKAYGAYEIGTLNLPLMISTIDFTNKIYELFKFLFYYFYLVVIGIVLVNLLLLMYIVIISPNRDNEYIYYILANIFLIPPIFDYITFYTLPISLLAFKKIIMASNCIMVIFTSIGLYKQFKKRVNMIAGIILLFVLLFGLIRFSALIGFVNYWNVLNLFMTINLVTWLYATAVNLKNSYIAKVIFITTLFTLYAPINMMILSTFNINIGMTDSRFLLFPLSFILITLYHYVELNRTIAHEQNRSQLMYERAIKDEMTDTYNHQYIVDFLEDKYGMYSIIMLDIDDFKEINDQYGHQTGDFVIKYVVEKIKSNIRKNDIVGRYGGDEFIIVLDKCPQEKGEEIAKKIKKDIKALQQTPQEEEIEVTVSLGVYQVEEEKNRKVVLKEVDQNLYQAKKEGKDRVVVG
ncbi:diguanylate cyclase [Halanaerobacter jeridensis]|uniref:Diguanylate cyclase (GGDEF)-like protein n=1 Tax=Halanaerobacter jeridensis TaxID=706427 RepID=A0A939BQC1_9FIRM|nr:diguanylate cyclase [Halanaerobacter jeridensis]MBM7556134.1 diguanylate cyclase (GGDEF)-like protein [Halanaerobacter jeridensis]